MGFLFNRVLIAAAFLAAFATSAAAQERWVRIINQSGYTLVEFYGSNKGSNSWEEDILGSSVVYNGSSVNINFDDGTGYCIFDFKAVFSGGQVVTKYGVNICELDSYTYTP